GFLTNRTRTSGWGLAGSKQLWEGNTSSDPAFRTKADKGTVQRSNDDFLPTTQGEVSGQFNGHYVHAIGRSERDVDLYVSARMGGAGASVRIGLRGSYVGSTSDSPQYSGYFLQVTAGSTTAILLKRSLAGTDTNLYSFLLPSAVPQNANYGFRVQTQGQTVRVKAWDATASEPSSWQATANDTTFTTGQVMLVTSYSSANVRSYTFTGLVAQLVTTTDSTTLDSVTSSLLKDGSVRITVTTEGDQNNNGLATLPYRAVDADTNLVGPTPTAQQITSPRKARHYDITGLTPDAGYAA